MEQLVSEAKMKKMLGQVANSLGFDVSFDAEKQRAEAKVKQILTNMASDLGFDVMIQLMPLQANVTAPEIQSASTEAVAGKSCFFGPSSHARANV